MGNLTFLGDVADWFDRTTNRIIEVRNNVIRSVDPSQLQGFNSYMPLGLMLRGQALGVHLLQDFADTLRLGNGVRSGTAGGVLEDGVRLLNVFDGAGSAVGRVGRVFRGFERQLHPMSCMLVSTVNALNRSGHPFFVNAADLATSAGLNFREVAELGTEVMQQSQMLRRLEEFGVRLTTFVSTARSEEAAWAELLTRMRNNPTGVFVVTVRQAIGRVHTMVATYHPQYGAEFVNTTGHVFQGIETFRAIRVYPSATHAQVLIHDAALAVQRSAHGSSAELRSAHDTLVSVGSIFLSVVGIVGHRLIATPPAGDSERTGRVRGTAD